MPYHIFYPQPITESFRETLYLSSVLLNKQIEQCVRTKNNAPVKKPHLQHVIDKTLNNFMNMFLTNTQ